MLKYKNVRIMLVLLLAAFLYVFVFGCDSTVTTTTVIIDGEEITITVEDDGEVKNADAAIEKAVEPLLDFGDNIVKEARDAEKGFLSGLFEATEGDDDDDFSDLSGIGNMTDRSIP